MTFLFLPDLTSYRIWLLSLIWHHQFMFPFPDLTFYWIRHYWIQMYRLTLGNGCGMPTRGAYSSRHPVPSHSGLAYVLLILESHPFPELVVIFPDYALRTSIGTFSILLKTEYWHFVDIYSSKSFAPLLFLCILNFKYLWNLKQWSDQSVILREKFVFCTHYNCFCKRPVALRGEIIFWSKTTFLTPKCKITVITCSYNVFSIIVWDFIKIDTKLQKVTTFSSIYPNEKLVKFQKLWLHRLNPSIIATRNVKWCLFYHYFDQQSSLEFYQ